MGDFSDQADVEFEAQCKNLGRYGNRQMEQLLYEGIEVCSSVFFISEIEQTTCNKNK